MTGTIPLFVDRIDRPEILSNDLTVETLYISPINEINWSSVRPRRGGVIFYTDYNGEKIFGFGISRKNGNITDFGGWIRYPKDHSAINGTYREFQEESYGAFSVTKEMLTSSPAIVSNVSLEIFIPAPYDPPHMNNRLSSIIQSVTEKSEIADIIWLTSKQLLTRLGDLKYDIHPRIRQVLIYAYLKYGDLERYLFSNRVQFSTLSDIEGSPSSVDAKYHEHSSEPIV